jgi:hypothetical protein
MVRRNLAGAAIAACTISLLVAGCSSASEDIDGSEAAATPGNPANNLQLAETCVRMFKRMEAVHDLDMRTGLIRWGCGDVPGVTNDDLGQEYCEDQVVQDGAIKKKAAELNPSGGAVSCVFTSVFADAHQDAILKPAMADPANLGVAAGASGVVQMRKGFNTRGAATQLMSDCKNSGTSSAVATRLRVSACYQAYARGGENAAQLATICKSNLSQAANWDQAVALGARLAQNGEPDFEQQRDIASCMAVTQAGVPWRNSDPLICSRTARSSSECSCQWNAVPNDLVGFEFTGWVDDHIPAGCRLAKVGGQDYPYVAICPVTQQEVADMPLNPLYAGNMGNFCHDRFGVDLVLKLPIRALQ